MAREPAALRYNNPGAQWDGPIAKKWGSKQHVVLADGQANHIAIFDTKVQGACAEFDLWRSRYTGLTLGNAIKKWCGGNFPEQYVKFLETKTGLTRDTMVTASLLAGENGLRLMKAQAHWEAGKPYPLSDAEWRQAQAAVFKGVKLPTKPSTGEVVVGGGIGAGTAAAAQQASAAGFNYGAIFGIIFVGIIIGAVVFLIMRQNRKDNQPLPLPIPDPQVTNPVPSRGAISDTPGVVVEELKR